MTCTHAPGAHPSRPFWFADILTDGDHLAEAGHRVDAASITTGTTRELLNEDDTTPLAANAVHQWRDREHGTGVPIQRTSDGKTGGQRAYEAYSKHVGGVSVKGDELPGWEGQLGGIRQAWEVAAAAGAPGGFHVSAGPATSVASGAVTTQVVGSLS